MDLFVISAVLLDLQIMDFELSEADMEKLNKTGMNQRLSPLEGYVSIFGLPC